MRSKLFAQDNEKLHRIPLGKLVWLIKYKAQEYGIEVVTVDEAYTSQTCSICGSKSKSPHKHRGLHVCKGCDRVLNIGIPSPLEDWEKVKSSAVLIE